LIYTVEKENQLKEEQFSYKAELMTVITKNQKEELMAVNYKILKRI